jgi:hypothetical protein
VSACRDCSTTPRGRSALFSPKAAQTAAISREVSEMDREEALLRPGRLHGSHGHFVGLTSTL